MLLKQQKISARISNHPSHNRLAFGEVTGVRLVCIGVFLHSDGHAAGKWSSLDAVETTKLPSFAMKSRSSKKNWYKSCLVLPELQFRRQVMPSKNPVLAQILSQSTDGHSVTRSRRGVTIT
jgi:hypothetical protein